MIASSAAAEKDKRPPHSAPPSPAHSREAGIQFCLGSASPEFTNEVQHLLRGVLQWGADTSSCHWRTDARLPAFKPKDGRSSKSRQLWIARHRRSLGNCGAM